MVWYDRGRQILADPTSAAGLGETPFAFLDDIIRIGLMLPAYTFNTNTHQQWGDTGVSTNEIAPTGYTARGNGIQLASKTVTIATPVVQLDAADLVYTSIGNGTNATFDAIVVMREQDAAATDANTELIAHSAVASTTTNGGNVTLVFASTGLLTLT